VDVPVSGRLVSDNFAVLRTAAECGLGVARLPMAVVHASIREGRLVTVLDGFASAPTPLHLLHVGDRRLPSRTRAFLDFAYPRIVSAIAEATAV
jgi:DNA-binding transcriptional LysR family regulator